MEYPSTQPTDQAEAGGAKKVSWSRPYSASTAWGATAGAFAVAIGLRFLLDPILGDQLPLASLFGAVAVSVWFGGYRLAAPGAAIGYLICSGLFIAPRGEWSFSLEGLIGFLLYATSCAAIIVFGEALHASRLRHRSSELRAQSETRQRERAEKDLHAVAENVAIPVTRCSKDLRYVWVSRHYANWIQRSPEEIVGRPIADIIGEKAFNKLLPHFHRVLGGETVRYEEQVAFAGLGPRWISATYSPIYSEAGECEGWVAVVLDIDERKRATSELERLYAELRESERQKDRFLAVLAHELRNPLAPIRSCLEILKSRGASDPEFVKSREVMTRQVGILTRLLDDLLDASRLSLDKLELRKEPLPLSSIVLAATETCQPILHARQHRLEVDMAGDSLYVEADPVRLEQVISNLINNAAKFTPPGGRVTIAVSRSLDNAVVSVRDNGIGMDEDAMRELFQMFKQSGGASEGGLGIGLSLARRLVEMHGGTLEARSDGRDRGSEFVVRLPIYAGAVAADVTDNESASLSAAACMRVLVVDDVTDSADSLVDLLRVWGHQAQAAYDGEEGIRKARSFGPDVMLIDLGMPRMDGYELCRRLRQEFGQGIHTVALTGWGAKVDQLRSSDAGFNQHLTKPADPAELRNLLVAVSTRAEEESFGKLRLAK